MTTGPGPLELQSKKKRSGCVVALYVLFGIGLFTILLGGAATYLFLQSDQGKEIVQAVKQGTEWIAEAATAPGTEELRAAGCQAALVSTASSALEVITAFVPDGGLREEIRNELLADAGDMDLDEVLLVACTNGRFDGKPPSCPKVARVYSEAVDFAPPAFYVIVLQEGASEPVCQGIHAPDGTPIE